MPKFHSTRGRPSRVMQAWAGPKPQLGGGCCCRCRRPVGASRAGNFRGRRTHNHRHHYGSGLEQISNSPDAYFLRPVSGAAKYPTAIPHHRDLFVIGRKGRFKAFFGLNGYLVLLVARPDCDSTAVSTAWTFLKSIIDPMVDRLDAKHRDLCRFLIGRGFAGCECLTYPRQITWSAQP